MIRAPSGHVCRRAPPRRRSSNSKKKKETLPKREEERARRGRERYPGTGQGGKKVEVMIKS